MAHLLFVQTEWFEHLGILSLAASAREHGHRVSLLIGRNPKKTVPGILALSPDVVALSATTGAHRVSLALARALRPSFKGKIVLGGPHATFFPEVVSEPCLDAVFRGEGDQMVTEFLQRIDEGADWDDLDGFWVKRGQEIIKNPPAGPVRDLDSLPIPARDLLAEADPYYARSSMRRIMAGRGCPYRCTYCFNEAMRELVKGKGPYVRLRSVDNVIAELKLLRGEPGRTINFVDDTFGLKRDWTMELLERYQSEIGRAFIINLRPEQVDAELSKALAGAGCYCVQMGVESARGRIRRELLGREVSDEVLEESARRIKEAGIRLLTYNMVGLPGESLLDAAATMEWNARMKVDFPRISIFAPYPRTVLGDKFLSGNGGQDKGEGEGANVDLVSESYFRRSPLPGREARRIENLHKLYELYIKFPRMRPFILAASRLPANPVFDLVFLFSIGLQYRKATNRGLMETIRLGIRNLRAYFS